MENIMKRSVDKIVYVYCKVTVKLPHNRLESLSRYRMIMKCDAPNDLHILNYNPFT